MGTEAVLACIHNLCFEQKLEKYQFFFSAENFHFYYFKNLCILHGQVLVMCYSGCYYKYKIYQQGETWFDGCDYVCQCVDGQKHYFHCKPM